MMKPKVYFTREITPESVVAIYHKLGVELPGRVAVKAGRSIAAKSSGGKCHAVFTSRG